MRWISAIGMALMCMISSAVLAGERLVVHEWGTFTSLQDENGRAIGGINEDVEALPAFAHDLLKLPNPAALAKGLPAAPMTAITMRLETPVVYFHPPKGAAPVQMDFSAEFHGGLLTQFYPDAKTNLANPGVVPAINEQTVGSLTWKDVKIGTGKAGPATDSHVWLAPRKVEAADVTATNGESERYLFYRGVAHLDSPLKVVRDSDRLQIYGQIDPAFGTQLLEFPRAWYFEMRGDGTCAFAPFGPLKAAAGVTDPIGWVNSILHEASFSTRNLAALRTDMHAALVKDGLFDDEADALLNTWEASYFKSAGARIFFLVPRTWTDHYLPIKLSADADTRRVMVGRIDLVTPQHRLLLHELASSASPTTPEFRQNLTKLGRFGRAMLMDEVSQTSPSKTAFWMAVLASN